MTPNLVLSIFPGIDLLGRAFEEVGYCVVRGPDLIWGTRVEDFHPPADTFEGILGGPPCQDFSRSRRTPPTGEGVRLLGEYMRVVERARPAWFLLENVVGVPSVSLAGYAVQRLNVNALECGSRQHRLRCFQFGRRDGPGLVLDVRSRPGKGVRPDPPPDDCKILSVPPAADEPRGVTPERCCMASEGSREDRRAWPDFCELQGLPRDFTLPGLTRSARYRAVGNGVPLEMGRVLSIAIRRRHVTAWLKTCICDCGRRVTGQQIHATAACRKRMERRRQSHSDVTDLV